MRDRSGAPADSRRSIRALAAQGHAMALEDIDTR